MPASLKFVALRRSQYALGETVHYNLQPPNVIFCYSNRRRICSCDLDSIAWSHDRYRRQTVRQLVDLHLGRNNITHLIYLLLHFQAVVSFPLRIKYIVCLWFFGRDATEVRAWDEIYHICIDLPSLFVIFVQQIFHSPTSRNAFEAVCKAFDINEPICQPQATSRVAEMSCVKRGFSPGRRSSGDRACASGACTESDRDRGFICGRHHQSGFVMHHHWNPKLNKVASKSLFKRNKTQFCTFNVVKIVSILSLWPLHRFHFL